MIEVHACVCTNVLLLTDWRRMFGLILFCLWHTYLHVCVCASVCNFPNITTAREHILMLACASEMAFTLFLVQIVSGRRNSLQYNVRVVSTFHHV